MFLFDISKSHIHVLPGHLQRSIPQDLLQAKGIPAVDEITHTESVPANVRMQLGNLCPDLDAVELFGDSRMRHRGAIDRREKTI